MQIKKAAPGPPSRLTFFTFDYGPTWSPDSTKVAFATAWTGGRDIWGTTVSFPQVEPTSLGRVKALFK